MEIPGAPFGIGGNLGLAISGTPTQNVSGPAVELFPSSTDLGAVSVGQTTSTKIVSLVNTGDQILAVNGISITGANAGDFAKSSTCGVTLAANANCSISVLFTPSQAGAEQAMVQVTDNAPGSPHSVVISGTGIAAIPSLAIAPGSADFGTILQGATAAPQTIKIMNSGTSALHVSAVGLSGSNPGDFSQTNTCIGGAVAVGQSCSITVGFSPKAEGQRTASLVLTDDAPNSPQSIALSGTATAPSVMVSPASVDFGTIAEGSTAAPQTVKITNSGSGSLHVTAVALSGANPGDFSQTNTCESVTVAANGSCSIKVNFSPTTEGQRTASITVNHDATNSPQSIALTGTLASPFQLAAAAASSTTATISAGQTAQYALQLTPGPGFSGTVAFSCSGAPLAATCNVAPVSMAVSGANATSFQVLVPTSGNAILVPATISEPRIRIWTAPILILIVMWMAAWCAQRKQLRARVTAFQLGFAMLILGLALIGSNGCGGGSYSSTVNPTITPSGTTILTVSAKSGTLTPQTIQLTLTVK